MYLQDIKNRKHIFITDYSSKWFKILHANSLGGIAYVGPSESEKQVVLTNRYQRASKYPLLIAQDLEWGLSMRLMDGMRFPKNMTLGAISDNTYIYAMGREIGNQAKSIGVHMNLSPVLDVVTISNNVAINVRSFGNSQVMVAEKGMAMIRGLQDGGIIASAKHFPGLGDITIDPHFGLPYIYHDEHRLYAVELYPFAQAIKASVGSIQTEHVVVPSLDASVPASLSHKIVTDLLKKKMKFSGLVLSGALRMKALTNHFSEEDIVLKAFFAGNDMLLMPKNFLKAYQIIQMAVEDGKIAIKDIDARVLKILQAKEKVGLHQHRITSVPTYEQLHSSSAQRVKKELFTAAVSFVRRSSKISFSLASLMAYVQLGETSTPTFLETIRRRIPSLDCFFFSYQGNILEEKRLRNNLDQYSKIVVAVYPLDPRRITEIRVCDEREQSERLRQFHVHGMTESLLAICKNLERYQEKVVIAFFGNAYGLQFFDPFETVLLAHEDDVDAQRAAADLLK